MSKIIEALEKAKREGKLESTSVSLEERSTVTSREVVGTSESLPGLRRRSGVDVFQPNVVDPADLTGVDPTVAALHHPMSGVAEQYRHLRSRLERLWPRGDKRVLAVTSAVKGEGKSLTAVNLAIVMAQNANKRVLLVDADLRRPRSHELLGLTLVPGLSEHLESGLAREQVVRMTPFFGLSVVTAGVPKGHPAELLASLEFGDFISWCREGYDFVLIDTPPVYPISDVGFLVDFVDGLLLVVRSAKASRDQVRKAMATLPEGKVVGAVLNRADDLGHGYGYKKEDYGYYTGYEKR